MGLETAMAIGAGSQILGAGLQYGEQRAARKRSQQASDKAMNITEQPLDANGMIANQINSGQDSYLQYLRSNPTGLQPFMFDYSKAFTDLQANDQQGITDQTNQLSAGAGSLGARYGSGFAASSALLRARALANIQTRNAGIAQSSFNTALNTGFADFSQAQNRQLSLLQLLQSGQLGQRGQELQALGFGASQPYPSTGALVGQTGSDLSTLLLLSGYLGKGAGAGGGATNLVPASVNYNPVFTG